MVLGFSSIIWSRGYAQQNIQFTQYIFNSLSVNPAYAGYKEEWFAQLGLRSQWASVDGAPKTGQLSLDGIVSPRHKNIGVGLQITSDMVGPQSATSAYASFAYRLQLNDTDTKRLSFGIGAGITQFNLDESKLRATNPADIALGTATLNSFIPDIRFGAYYYTPRWYAGFSVLDLVSASQDNSIFKWSEGSDQNIKREPHLYFMSGMLFDLSEQIKFKPSVLFKEDFKGPTSADINTMFIFNKRIWLGASYRSGFKLWKQYNTEETLNINNAVAGIVQLYINDKIRVGYSYDYGLNSIANTMRGAHEISIGFTFSRRENRLLSPRFF